LGTHDMAGSNFLYETQRPNGDRSPTGMGPLPGPGNRHTSFAGWYLPYESLDGELQPAEAAAVALLFRPSMRPCHGDLRRCAPGDFAIQSAAPARLLARSSSSTGKSSTSRVLIILLAVQGQRGRPKVGDQTPPAGGSLLPGLSKRLQSDRLCGFGPTSNLQNNRPHFRPLRCGTLSEARLPRGTLRRGLCHLRLLELHESVAFPGEAGIRPAGPRCTQLYFADYKARAFGDADYAPVFARRRFSASLAGNSLMLKWQCITGDPIPGAVQDQPG